MFHLLPPCDVYRMNLRAYPAATYSLHPQHASVTSKSDTINANCSATAPETDGVGKSSSCDEANASVALPHGKCKLSMEQVAQLETGEARLVPQLQQPRMDVVWSDVEPEDLEAQAPDLPAPLVAEVSAPVGGGGNADVTSRSAMRVKRQRIAC